MIEKGDMVQLIFACCDDGIRNIGWTGMVLAIENCPADSVWMCHTCGHSMSGIKGARVNGPTRSSVLPLSWLIKVPPKTVEKVVEEEVVV